MGRCELASLKGGRPRNLLGLYQTCVVALTGGHGSWRFHHEFYELSKLRDAQLTVV